VKPDRIGRYSITKELGKGSMGVVYEGQSDAGGPPVAIKVFFPDAKLSATEIATLRERFGREGQELSKLHHRNVVQVLEVGEDKSLEYIVMEKLPGYNLKELLELGTRFTLAETFDIMLQLLAGLGACHQNGLVHRDVKPANVVRTPSGDIKLTDFGIARIITDATLSRAGTVVGTPNYMSPEQIRGEDVDARSDIFSSGVLMFELLTGKKPFEGPDVTAIMYNVTTIQPPSPRFYNGALPEELDQISSKALSKDLSARYATVEEFAQALRALEDALHYREGTEAILNAVPAAPDPDAVPAAALQSRQPLGSPGGRPLQGPSTSSLAGLSGQGVGPLGAGGAVLPNIMLGAGAPTPDTVFCVDCGEPNPGIYEFCQRCMRPLLKRSTVTQLASQQAKLMSRSNRGDYLFMGCLSFLMVATVILILWLFFRNTI